MKNKIYFKLIWVFALVSLFACEPMIDDNPDSGMIQAPSAEEMDFSISAGEDAYRFNVELLSPVISGIAQVSFDLGNGSSIAGKTGVAYYPLPDNYTITMTIKTNTGSTSITKVHTTTETDYSIFTDEKFVFLTGGVDDLDGKTWMVDASQQGHFGVGSTGSDGLEWWSASPFTKEGTGAYDDELTFNINEFKVTYDNKGVSYVKSYMKDDPNLANVYLNPRQIKDDWDVDYQTPVSGTWGINERDGKFYLSIIGDTPLVPGLDVGPKNNEYEIVKITENTLELTCFSAYEDWTKWHFLLIDKDYERPSVNFEVAFVETGETNEYELSLSNVDIPTGQSIDKVVIDFGDGIIKETSDYMETLSNVYMRKGTYPVKVTVTTSVGEEASDFSANVAENHPDYVPFLLDEQVMYLDFSEVQLGPIAGEDALVAITDNPSRIYPNRSANVAFYQKTDQQWANAFMKLPPGHRFDLRQAHTFKMMVYGKAGDVVLLKLENTDKGGDAWQTGTELSYTIQEDNTWEVAEYDFLEADVQPGAEGWKWWAEPVSYDVVNEDTYNHDFYNVLRIMLNPGVGEETHEFYFDELAGPHVEGLKSAKIGS